jgi:hypothetical protein
MTDYKATPEQWAQCEDWVKSSVVGASDACILELRARVETLEAAAHKHIVETSDNILKLASRIESLEAAEREASKVYQISKPLKLTSKQQDQLNALLLPNSSPTPNSSQSGRSLVKRVALVISGIEYGSETDEEAVNWSPEARAAIREVAMWMRENEVGYTAARWLEQEANQ